MQELATKKQKAIVSEVRLELQATDIPSYALPRGESGARLVMPTEARLLLRNGALRIEMIVTDPETWGNQFYDQPTFDDENPAIIFLNLDGEDILRLTIGGYTYGNRYPTAVLVMKDPSEVEDELSLTFASTDSNNPKYAIKALKKMLQEKLDVTIEEMRHELEEVVDDIPF
jgi:hypothetical protein